VFFEASGRGGVGPSHTWVLRLDDRSGHTAQPLVTAAEEWGRKISPDGRWLAVMSNGEVYVRPFPGPGGRTQVSVGGGMWPIWGPDGRRLLYLKSDTAMS